MAVRIFSGPERIAGSPIKGDCRVVLKFYYSPRYPEGLHQKTPPTSGCPRRIIKLSSRCCDGFPLSPVRLPECRAQWWASARPDRFDRKPITLVRRKDEKRDQPADPAHSQADL